GTAQRPICRGRGGSMATITGDYELTARDIQALSGPDAVAALFATLGYDTTARVTQSPAAMGITAESLRRKVRRIERLAEQDAGELQVYLVELDSVTVAAITALARTLRTSQGRYLLALTSDYHELD